MLDLRDFGIHLEVTVRARAGILAETTRRYMINKMTV